MSGAAKRTGNSHKQKVPPALQDWLKIGQERLDVLRQRSIELAKQLDAEGQEELRDYFFTLSFWEVFDGFILERLDDYNDTKAWLQQQKAKEQRAFASLSKLQREILIKIYELSRSGFGKVRWEPQVWFNREAKTVFSRSIQSLDTRGLVFRYSAKMQPNPQRTIYVELTNLGLRLAEKLATSNTD